MLPTGHRLGDLGLQFQRAVKIQHVGVQIVTAFELHVRAGNAKGKFAESDDAVIEFKTALMREITSSISSFFGCPCPRRLRLSIWSWMVDFRKCAFGNIEAPIETQLVLHFSIQVRNLKLGFEIELAFHEGLALHGQTQDVPHAPLRHVYVELDGAVTVAFVFEDGAAGGEVRGSERGVNGLEEGVSVGAVHQDLELRAQWDGVARALEPEIRHVGFAARGDGIQFPFEASFRLQNAGNYGKNAQVRVVERVVSIQREYRPVPRSATDRRSRSCGFRPAAGGW